MVGHIHGEGLEGLHILIWLHLQFALLAHLGNIASCLLQLTQRLRQGLGQLYLFLQAMEQPSLLACLLPIGYCLLPTTYYLLPTTCCLLPAAYYLLPIAGCILLYSYGLMGLSLKGTGGLAGCSVDL